MAALRVTVEFRSDGFAAEPGEDEKINPGRWGIALARYLRAELTARGFSSGEPIFEDWGCCVPIENDAFDLWVGCGNYEEHPDGFLCFINPPIPYIRRWFRKIETSARVEALSKALEDALRSHPSVRDLRWWSLDEMARG